MLATLRPARVSDRVPPQVFFLVSAVSRYLGPAFAVLLFARVNVLGVAWLRIVSAAAIFALWRRPWRIAASQSGAQRTTLLALGVALDLMNVVCRVRTSGRAGRWRGGNRPSRPGDVDCAGACQPRRDH